MSKLFLLTGFAIPHNILEKQNIWRDMFTNSEIFFYSNMVFFICNTAVKYHMQQAVDIF